jgi:hypothetical protein
MDQLDKIKRHAALFDDMATHVGVDLQEAAIRGDVSFDEISQAVVRCAGCLQPARCALRIRAAQADAERGAPLYCRNTALLERLGARR